MARIPDEQIERLKTELSLVRLVETFGVELKKVGKDYHGRCPFHNDRTPSLVISPESNLWHCLGACQVGGSVIDWVMKAQGVSFRLAVELLQAESPSLAADIRPVKKSTVQRLPVLIAQDADEQALMQQVIGYYHDTLKTDPEALAYLDKRGLNHPDMIAHFQLGYANRTLGYRLPKKNRVDGAVLRGRLQSIGIYRASGHEHFNGSLVVPVVNDGVITDVYGRKIRDDLRPGTPVHLYLPGPHRGVFNLDALKTAPEIILCESLLDALTFWCAGYRHVTTSYGVEGFTPALLAAFQHYGTQRVLIAYDRDEAGDKAAVALAAKLTAEGIDCFRVVFPKGMDANEYALKVGPAHKSLGLALRKAQWLGQGKAPERQVDIEEILTEQDITKPAASAKIPETKPALVPHTAPVPEPEALPTLAALPTASSAESPPTITPAQPLPASPVPAMTPSDIAVEVTVTDVLIPLGDRRYRVRGLTKNSTPDQLKINLLVALGERFHVDTLDLYSARQRGHYLAQAAAELGVNEDIVRADLGKVLLKLEELQDQHLRQLLEPTKPDTKSLDDGERAEALALLQSPDLIARILDDFARCGVVGEETNKLVGYLACVSRKLAKPLAVIIQSSSAAGKSSLMDAVLQLMPEEERVQYSAMTGQSLFYMGETNLKHKILAIAEEEGAERASYALKLLQSDGSLTMASTGKDPQTGNLVTQEYRVEGPVMIFLTTTAIEIDEELLNRCLVLTVNESREQTQAIHALQRARQTLAGLLAEQDRNDLSALHRNAQRLLRPLAVVNPYADRLTFLDSQTRTRRDHMKYLTLIQAIALLHQYQRPVKTVQHKGKALDYIEVTLDDIATANRLAHDVLGRSLDELPPQTRRLLQLLRDMISAQSQAQGLRPNECRFTRKVLREYTQWGDTQLKIHLQRLVELEYVLTHRSAQHAQALVYELAYQGEGEHGERFLTGLIDVENLRYDGNRSGTNADRSASGRGPVGAWSAPGRVDENAENPEKNALFPALAAAPAETALFPPKTNGAAYRSDSPAAV